MVWDARAVLFMVIFPSAFACILAAIVLWKDQGLLAFILSLVGGFLFVVSGIITDGFGGSER